MKRRPGTPLFPVLLAVAAPALFTSCGDSTSPRVPATVTVMPELVTMDALGMTEQLTVTVLDKKGKILSSPEVEWVSSNPDVVSVSTTGLVTAVGEGDARVRAYVEGLIDGANFIVAPIPAAIAKITGDQQMAPPDQLLPEEIELEVRDSQGNGMGDVAVSFSVRSGGGTISPGNVRTDAQGRASATWTLGCSGEATQTVRATAGAVSAEFTTQVDFSNPIICQTSVPQGRATHAYQGSLEAYGDNPEGMRWEVESGALPSGITLAESGVLDGVPTEAGTFPFRATVRDGNGSSASQEFDLLICEPPLELEAGESVSLVPSGVDGCGFFLPSGSQGDRYRVGVLWDTSNRYDTIPAVVTVSMDKRETEATPAERGPPPRPFAAPPSAEALLRGLPEGLAQALEADSKSEAFRQRLWESERELLRRLGPGAPILRDRRPLLRGAFRSPVPSPEKRIFYPNAGSSCDNNTIQTTALKVAENDHIVIYQDSAQAQVDSLEITVAMAERMLDYYRDYGKTTIDTYFGGVTDVNGDGRVVVLVTPVVSSSAVAYVWSGDLRSGVICPASNEMELVRFRASAIRGLLSGRYQPLGTLVHEVKHLSSLYNGMSRFNLSGGEFGYHPTWIEEGTATLAGEISSRLAWAGEGGPAFGAMVRGVDREVTPASYYMNISLARGMFYLSSQPNGVVAVPRGASSRHSVYGSGWHFHRWLGDAYGGASNPLSDGPLFTLLNDSLSAAGVMGIESATGKSWSELLDEYAAAIMLNGTEAPVGPRAITSYHMPEATAGLYDSSIQPPGFYPWPVNLRDQELTGRFESAYYFGQVGPSGIKVFDLASDGTGSGLEVMVSTTQGPLRLVVVRVR